MACAAQHRGGRDNHVTKHTNNSQLAEIAVLVPAPRENQAVIRHCEPSEAGSFSHVRQYKSENTLLRKADDSEPHAIAFIPDLTTPALWHTVTGAA